jgi:hypothetical protein
LGLITRAARAACARCRPSARVGQNELFCRHVRRALRAMADPLCPGSIVTGSTSHLRSNAAPLMAVSTSSGVPYRLIASGYSEPRAISFCSSSGTASDVFCPKLPLKRKKPNFPFGRQRAASMPSAGVVLSDNLFVVPSKLKSHEHAREGLHVTSALDPDRREQGVC